MPSDAPLHIAVALEQLETIVITVENLWLPFEPLDDTSIDLLTTYNQAKELSYA